MNLRLQTRAGIAAAGPAWWRQVFLLLVAGAFLLQGYVAQSHFHPIAPRAVSATDRIVSLDSGPLGAVEAKHQPSRDNLPGNDDPAKCPLCHVLGQAGHFVWPQAAALVLPFLTFTVVPLAAAAIGIPIPQSHDWHGRAPPAV